MAGYKFGQGKVFVTNNVPYGRELNDGHSRQEPAGFVQRSIVRALNQSGLV